MAYVVDRSRERTPDVTGETNVYTSCSRPVASEEWVERGAIVVHDEGEPSTIQKCLPTSDGGFEWVILQQSS